MPKLRPANGWFWSDADSLKTTADELVLGATGTVNLYESSSNILRTDDTLQANEIQVPGTGVKIALATGGYIDCVEITAPAAPGTNTGRLWVEDNGADKSRLVVRFPSGANQVIATEP